MACTAFKVTLALGSWQDNFKETSDVNVITHTNLFLSVFKSQLNFL